MPYRSGTSAKCAMEFTFLFILLIATSSECRIFTKEQEDQITEIVELTMACHHIPGLTLSVVKGSSSWTRGYGTADISTDRSVHPSTLFAIGSLSKAFTMTTLAMLLNETSYTWSTKLKDIEGINVSFMNETITREVTLADLLSHNTGLCEVLGFMAGYPQGTTKECLSRQLKHLPQRYGFRSDSFEYNNMMYMLVGHVIEVLGKDTWENLVTSRIFEPLGMASSKIISCTDDVLKGDVAKPYIMPKDKFVDSTTELYKIAPLEPAGAIQTNAEDMSKWLQFNLRNGTTPDGYKLVESDLFTEAFKNHHSVQGWRDLIRPPFPVNDLTTGYGYAWFSSTYRGHDRSWHSGSFFSYLSKIWLFPEQDLGIYVNVNGPGTRKGPMETINVIMSVIADIALGLEPWLNTTTACSFPAPWVDERSVDWPKPPEHTNDHLEDFTGTYGNQILPDIGVSLTGSNGNATKKLELHWNRITGDLHPTTSRDKFKFTLSTPWEYKAETMFTETLPIYFPVNFHRDDAGEVQSFDFDFGDPVLILFQKNIRFSDGCKLAHRSLCKDKANGSNGNTDLKPSSSWMLLVLLVGGLTAVVVRYESFDA